MRLLSLCPLNENFFPRKRSIEMSAGRRAKVMNGTSVVLNSASTGLSGKTGRVTALQIDGVSFNCTNNVLPYTCMRRLILQNGSPRQDNADENQSARAGYINLLFAAVAHNDRTCRQGRENDKCGKLMRVAFGMRFWSIESLSCSETVYWK